MLFFSQWNYAKFAPVYLAQVFVLKVKVEEAWNLLNDINEYSIQYTTADLALEKANKTTKIHVWIKEIAYSQVVLNQYFITAPENSSIVEKFYTFFGIINNEDQEPFYQLKGGKKIVLQIM